MRAEDILLRTPAGICCKIGGFHIDPTRAVDKAVITHGHSDHARAGHGAVLATQETLDLMRLRYGENFAGSMQAIRYGETITLGGARVTFHPAGHVLGSAQERQTAFASSPPVTTRTSRIRPARHSNLFSAMYSSPRPPSDYPSLATAIPRPRLQSCSVLFACFPTGRI